jgi:hypothetical protein
LTVKKSSLLLSPTLDAHGVRQHPPLVIRMKPKAPPPLVAEAKPLKTVNSRRSQLLGVVDVLAVLVLNGVVRKPTNRIPKPRPRPLRAILLLLQPPRWSWAWTEWSRPFCHRRKKLWRKRLHHPPLVPEVVVEERRRGCMSLNPQKLSQS